MGVAGVVGPTPPQPCPQRQRILPRVARGSLARRPPRGNTTTAIPYVSPQVLQFLQFSTVSQTSCLLIDTFFFRQKCRCQHTSVFLFCFRLLQFPLCDLHYICIFSCSAFCRPFFFRPPPLSVSPGDFDWLGFGLVESESGGEGRRMAPSSGFKSENPNGPVANPATRRKQFRGLWCGAIPNQSQPSPRKSHTVRRYIFIRFR